MQPLAFAENGRVWVGMGSWLAGPATAHGSQPCPRSGPARPKKTCQGREGWSSLNPTGLEKSAPNGAVRRIPIAEGIVARLT